MWCGGRSLSGARHTAPHPVPVTWAAGREPGRAGAITTNHCVHLGLGLCLDLLTGAGWTLGWLAVPVSVPVGKSAVPLTPAILWSLGPGSRDRWVVAILRVANDVCGGPPTCVAALRSEKPSARTRDARRSMPRCGRRRRHRGARAPRLARQARRQQRVAPGPERTLRHECAGAAWRRLCL